MNTRSWWVYGLGIALTTTMVQTSRGDTPVHTDTNVVELRTVGAEAPVFEATLVEALRRAQLRINSSSEVSTEPTNAVVRVTVRVEDSTSVTILVEDLRPNGTRVERSIARSSSLAVTSEEVALVVRTTVDTLLAEPAPDLDPTPERETQTAQGTTTLAEPNELPKRPESRSPPPPEEPQNTLVPDTAPEREPPLQLELAGFGQVRSFAKSGGAVPGVGTMASVRRNRHAQRWGAWVGASYASLGSYEMPGVDLGGSVTAVRAGLLASVLQEPAASLEVLGGGGVDLISLRVATSTDSANEDSRRIDASAVGSLLVVTKLALGTRTSFLAAAEVDTAFSHQRYLVAEGPTRLVLLDPARVRWVAIAGFNVSFSTDHRGPNEAQR